MEELRNKIIDILNESSQHLPIEAIYYVVKDVYREVQDTYNVILKRGMEEENKEESKEEEEE